ncbi:DUF6900 domain-containing protein [Eleftheria terrae]|uniref:DUF6900 domain-containing protein n=1 Tax=Eleftheria terrae TaxID=1597781 RepID=UPI00263A7885|nr:hypothetical protein [Eleftheria terrae]WKB50788.1 hypothetical protein N7L95_13280 [Eleftheria terrae]
MQDLNTLLTAIASQHLSIETLEVRYSDRLDFHGLSVWEVRAALEAAFQAGYERGLKSRKKAAEPN